MKIKSELLRSFEELNEKEQQTVIDKNRNINVDGIDNMGAEVDNFNLILVMLGFKEINIKCSLVVKPTGLVFTGMWSFNSEYRNELLKMTNDTAILMYADSLVNHYKSNNTGCFNFQIFNPGDTLDPHSCNFQFYKDDDPITQNDQVVAVIKNLMVHFYNILNHSYSFHISDDEVKSTLIAVGYHFNSQLEVDDV